MGERQHRLDEPCHPGGCLEVAEVRLHRADRQRAGAGAGRGVDGLDRLHLYRVTKRCTGAVCLDVVDLLGRDPAIGQGIAEHRFLGADIRHGQSARAAVMVDGRAADDRQDRVAPG